MWQDYFRNGMIYGIDIEDKSAHEDKRIKIFRGSQSDSEFLEKVATEVERIDIVIDDGSHRCVDAIASFHVLFPRLADGGIYVIEDLQTTYWPPFGGNWKDVNDPATTMSLLKSLIDGLNYQYIPRRVPTYFDEHITSIAFHPKMVFIFKGRNRHALSPYAQEVMKQLNSSE
jgi:hypothetical protein